MSKKEEDLINVRSFIAKLDILILKEKYDDALRLSEDIKEQIILMKNK